MALLRMVAAAVERERDDRKGKSKIRDGAWR